MTNIEFAKRISAIVYIASGWATSTIQEAAHHNPPDPATVRRFTDEIRRVLDRMEADARG